MELQSITLLQSVGIYVDSFKNPDEHESTNRELHRFVQWCGPERVFAEINPSEIGDYAEQMGGTGTSPLAAERLKIVRAFLSYARKKGLIEKNLAQHVRIRKSKSRSMSQSQISESPDAIELSPQRHASIVGRLDDLKAKRGPIASAIQKAAADKDVRENAPLEAAREELGHVESQIRDLEATLNESVIVTASKARKGPVKTVKVGMKVTVKDANSGKQTTYSLVSRTESNPLEGRISDVSPMGKAVIGKSVGQSVEVQTPRGKQNYQITRVTA